MMQLLDSTLAFVLTLAALATVVTVIMEACLRIARMRKKNFIEVMKLLNRELGSGTLGMDDNDRWRFIVRVIQNPAEAAIEQVNPVLQKLKLEERLAFLGNEKKAGKTKAVRLLYFLRQIFGDKKRAGLYTNVSLEYMLRCLAASPPVKKATLKAREAVMVEFNRLARKYEELGSSVSASFKHHAQAWSIAIGIVLAIVANIDGLRVFEAYRVDPKLATAVIEKQEAFLNNYEKSQKSLSEFDAATMKLKTAKEDLTTALQASPKKQADIDRLKKELETAEAEMEKQVALKNVQLASQRAQQQMADLVSLGVPIGWQIYPNCPFGGSGEEWAMSSPKCKSIPVAKRQIGQGRYWFGARIAKTAYYDLGGFILWLMVATGTGVLIGLGAPFWFDVAKRLSQIRKGLQSATASTEYRLSGNNSNGDYEKRKKIVSNVISEAADEAAREASGRTGRRQAFFDLKGDDHERNA